MPVNLQFQKNFKPPARLVPFGIIRATRGTAHEQFSLLNRRSHRCGLNICPSFQALFKAGIRIDILRLPDLIS